MDPGVLRFRLASLTLEERGAYMSLLLESYRGFGRYEPGRVDLPNAKNDGDLRYILTGLRVGRRVLDKLVVRELVSIGEDGAIWCVDYEHGAWLRRGATVEELRMVVARHGAACAHCGATENLTVDHVEPVAKGGDERLENFQPLCRPCNSRKGARPDA